MTIATRTSSSVINFDVFNLPPYTPLSIWVNGTNHTLVSAPLNGYIGDEIITDGTGQAKGTILLNEMWTSFDGVIQIWFKHGSERDSIYSAPKNAIFASVTANRSDESLSNGGNSVIPEAANRGQEAATTLSPLTQTFFVDAGKYPQGLAITSLELYFSTKDSELPVSIEFRRVVNGAPSAGDVIHGTPVVKLPSEVNVPANPNSGLGPSTKFSFNPLYFPPGEYAFSVISNSPNYTLYSGKLGASVLGTGEIVNKEPYTGRLFKSQNTNLWLEETNTDLCFKLNKAKFETGTVTFELQTAETPEVQFDSVYLDTASYNFGDLTNIDYTLKGKRWPDSADQPYVYFKEKTPFNLVARWRTKDVGDTKVAVTFTNNNPDISPFIDKGKTVLYSFKNLIEPYEIDTRDSEIYYGNGVASSKYISKIVTLEEGFDSTGLEVKLDVNRKTGTDIGVYCRVISGADNGIDSSIEKLAWKIMPLFNQNATVSNQASYSGNVGKTFVGLSETEFHTETYKILEEDSLATTGTANLSYNATLGGVSTTFNSFNKFQIKIIFYSNNSTVVPKIKNLIGTAVI